MTVRRRSARKITVSNSVLFCQLQFPHGLSWNRTRVSTLEKGH